MRTNHPCIPPLYHYNNINDEALLYLIWHYKFELLLRAYEYIKSTDKNEKFITFIDSGACREGRIQLFKHFIDNDFLVRDTNTIVICYSKDIMNKTLDVTRLCNAGAYEVSCNAMSFAVDYLHTLFNLYFAKLDECIKKGFVTTEQRIFTLVMHEEYNKTASMFTFKYKDGDGYTCCFSY